MPGGPGGPMPGGPGGMPGVPPLPADPDADEDLATLVVVVLEVNCRTPNYARQFDQGQAFWFDHKWGRAIFQKSYDKFDISLVPGADGKPLPTVRLRFQRQFGLIMNDRDKLTPENLLALARKALEYGLLDRYIEVMEKLVEVDKDGPQVKRYLQVKEMLSKPMPPNPVGDEWKEKVLEGYKVIQKPENHFTLLHSFASDEVPEVKAKLERLDRTLRGIYYWWAMQDKGGVLPLPKQRLVSVLTDRGEDFNRLKKQFATGPVISDSFLARREGVAVFSTRRGDEHYEKMEASSEDFWKEGFNRVTILRGTRGLGMPRNKTEEDAYAPRLSALMLRALEHEWEENATTHEVGRKLPFALGMIAPKVHAPEWIQFGMGSLFERPLQSPWGGIGVANSYYLPRFREALKEGKYGQVKTSLEKVDLMARVVTDELFHLAPGKLADGKEESSDAVQRRARAAAWSLVYYLTKNDLTGLQNYFKQLSRLPRDVDLDREVLLHTFAKALNCLNAEGKVDRNMLATHANRWLSFIDKEQMEGQKIHEAVRKAYETVKKNPSTPGGTGPGGYPGGPGGPGGPMPGGFPGAGGAGPR
jgi:hypothetical protein